MRAKRLTRWASGRCYSEYVMNHRRLSPRLALLFACALGLAAVGCDDDPTPVDAGSPPDGSTPPDDAGPATSDDAGPPDPGCDVEERAYQPFTRAFTGPAASETDSSPNPFTDYRLTVTFTAPSGARFAVPGFFDGDGEGGASGDVYRVRFTAPEAGEWTYDVSFVAGDGVALDPDATGTAEGPDGESGTICVGNPDASAPGLLAHGRLRYADAHYLRHEDGTWWIKGGADSPENLLGYAGFDDVEDLPGGASTAGLMDGVHRYTPHIDDWNEGDPDWNDGAGRGIIGALNYLGSQSVNSIYFLPCNLGGDGRDTHPYVTPDDLDHIDVNRMRQWEIVFAHAERLGIALHFVLSETETGNEELHDGGTLGPERRLFYREMVARFAHHNGVFWNIGEENDYGPTRQTEFAAFLDAVDPYDNPTTVHTHVNRPAAQYDALVGGEHFDMTSIQLSPERAAEFTEAWRRQSADAGRPWVVMLDEIAPAGVGVTDTNAPEIRELTLWPALMSGAGGVEWYFGYHALPLGGDMRTEDFRTREEMWVYTRNARRFFEDNVPFWEMEPADELLRGTGDVLAKPGEVYAVYLPSGAAGAELDVGGTGSLALRWYDPRAGAFVGAAVDVDPSAPIALDPPSEPGMDWVALLEGAVTPITPPVGACDYRAVNGIVVIEGEDLPASGDWTRGTDGGALGGGFLMWTGAQSFGSSANGRLGVDVRIDEPGLYRLSVRARVGNGTDATEHNDTWFRIDGDAYYGIRGAAPNEDHVYPRPLCEDSAFLASVEADPDVVDASCPNGTSHDGYFKVYCSGALDWRWSAFTSDSDGHDIYARFDAPGVYRLRLAARSSHHQIDRIVLHRAGVSNAAARDASLTATRCP